MEVSTTLPPDPGSARVARDFVVTAMSQWRARAQDDIAILLTSELVTNSLLHAPSLIRLTVRLNGLHLRVEVGDTNPRVPQLRHYSAESGTGRGLRLIEDLASSWGTEATPHGKVVWFELPVTVGG